MSCLLFHGPGARQAAVDEVGRRGGLLMHEPFGDSGLKVDEAREFVSLLQSPPIGIAHGVVIAGPMDQTAGLKADDALLKSIEHFNEYVIPILWAFDIGGVKPTIRSRCIPVWSPPTGFEPVDEEVEATARELLVASLNGHCHQIPDLVAKMARKGDKKPARYNELLAEAVEGMTVLLDNPKVFPLWERVRAVLQWQNPTQVEVISAFLPEVGVPC